MADIGLSEAPYKAQLDEIRIRKDGIYNFYGNSEQLETLSLEQWTKEGHGCPRFGVLFDDKG